MTDPGGATFPRFIYVPWVSDQPHSARADETVELATELAAQIRRPVIGIASTKDQLPDDWGKRPYRTRKSSAAATSGPAVEVHFWPSLDDLAAMNPGRAAHAFILEFGSDDLSGWARHHHAVHFDTKDELTPALSAEAISLYESIDRIGNNSWHDDYGKRDALRDLRRLRDIGELDPGDLAGYMIGRHSHTAIRKLLELAKKA
ncbi:signal recognition particle GTPase [Microbacterium testaceum StLB037]|uniref:Signal recognition particle GTPase n=1 Tax=Microbacterium testaceum (strain StLB037) TaxID=979556 RepID=E8N9G7_MICTS|nr:hypothetical protein [Microbacterium testaceum]BAJ73214.1 signal recognition particle GTPase [Microbacterium testaceum StLB037]